MSESALGKATSDSTASDKGFSCSSCGKNLTNSASLYHVRNVCPSAGIECPECEKLFAVERGMKMHYSQDHNGTLAGIEVTCEYCGDVFRQRVQRAKNDSRDFCSQSCHNDWMKFDAPDSRYRDRVRVTVSCNQCGEDIERRPSDVERAKRQFCSKSCHAEWRSENIRGEDHPNWQGGPGEFECEYCGSSITRRRSHTREKVFCDHSCYGNWLTENLFGEKHPNYRGGLEHYGPNWPRQRRKAQKRDHYQCQICGKDERDLGQIPDTHHLTKIRKFKEWYDAPEWYEKGNRLDNLVLLCRDHHKEWEGIPLIPQVD